MSLFGSEEKVPSPGEGGIARLPRRYPWTARIIAPKAVGSFASGSLVKVSGMEGERYLISARTHKAAPSPDAEKPVPADAGSLDEALSRALDTLVMDAADIRSNITWASDLAWLSLRFTTKKTIRGKKVVNGKPDGPEITFPPGAQVTIEEWKDGKYLGIAEIGEDDFAGIEVTSEDLTGLDESVPWASPQRRVSFICHQLAPYVACKSGLRDERDFYRAMLTSKKNIETIDFWLAFCDAKLDKEAMEPGKVKPEQFSRGDLVVFYKYNGFAHVAIATGRTAESGSPSLYSLWDNRETNPIIDDIAGICAHAKSIDKDHPIEAIRTATPAWYLPG